MADFSPFIIIVAPIWGPSVFGRLLSVPLDLMESRSHLGTCDALAVSCRCPLIALCLGIVPCSVCLAAAAAGVCMLGGGGGGGGEG